jgi:valyl-tRNA synthetase
MPFVTEAIWQEMHPGNLLLTEKWPYAIDMPGISDTYYFDNTITTDAEKDFSTLQKVITKIRNLRSEYSVDPGKKLALYIKSGKQRKLLGATIYSGNQPQYFFENNKAVFSGLARLESIQTDQTPPPTAISFLEDWVEAAVDLVGAVDIEKEKARLEKELAEAEKYVTVLQNKLANQDFVARAPEAVIAGERSKLAVAEEKVAKTKAALENLKG